VRGTAPDYTHKKIHEQGEELDRLCERGRRAPAGAGGGAGSTSELVDGLPSRKDRDEVLADLAVVAEDARKALSKVITATVAAAAMENTTVLSPSSSSQAAQDAEASVVEKETDEPTRVYASGGRGGNGSDDESVWRREAVRLWGARVVGAEAAAADGGSGGGPADVLWSWESYVTSRLSVAVPTTPDNPLLQELYKGCAWRLLVSCVLMSRVSSADTKRRCIDAFFHAFPTPSACLDACTPELALPILDSLGLFENRFKSVIDITKRFLADREFDCRRDGEHKIYGVGDFGVASFEIWCRGLGKALKPNDKNLAAFCSWLRATEDTPSMLPTSPLSPLQLPPPSSSESSEL